MVLHILWVIGITAEGMTGALAAGREKMDHFGVIMVACVTAIGGGTIRDVLLGNYPLVWVESPQYVLLVSVAAILTVSIARLMQYFRTIFLVLDSLGLVVFAIIGTQIALDLGHGFIIASVASIVTGVSGGIMRDLFCNRIPLVFRKELYATICLGVTALYMTLGWAGVNETAVIVISLVTGFVARLLAIRFEWALPVFDYQESNYEPLKPLRGRLFRRHGPHDDDPTAN